MNNFVYFTNSYTIEEDELYIYRVKNSINGNYLAQIMCPKNNKNIYILLGIFANNGLKFKTLEKAEAKLLIKLTNMGYKLLDPNLEILI
jgi:hypothetical protein